MSTQTETTNVRDPFKIFLQARKWHVEHIVGNQFQEGFPDLYIYHHQYGPRWVEIKHIKGTGRGTISFTNAQKIKFPRMHSCGVPIIVIAARDLRGIEHANERERLYKKLFEQPNVMLAMDVWTQHVIF